MVGGAIGSALRYAVYLCLPLAAHRLPIATLAVNIIGSMVLGLVSGLVVVEANETKMLFLLLGTGLCGGFTTLSTFSMELLVLVQGSQLAIAVAYVAITVVGGLGAAWIGFTLSKSMVL